MAGTIRSFTVAGWATSGLAAPDELLEAQLASWLERYEYQAAPSLTLGTPGTGLSVRIYKANPAGYEGHAFLAAVGLTAAYEMVLIKDPGALIEFL